MTQKPTYEELEQRIKELEEETIERKQAEEVSRSEALNEINTLRGILPLCSFCKKVRDDKGTWEQIDIYIHKYSQADISHGVCPDCAKRHYPDLHVQDD